MSPALIALILSVATFLAVFAFANRGTRNARLSARVEQLAEGGYSEDTTGDGDNIPPADIDGAPPLPWRFVPTGSRLYLKMVRAGIEQKHQAIFLGLLAIAAFFSVLLAGMGFPIPWLLGILAGYTVLRMFLSRQVDKRQRLFLENFCDAVDMIVRGVRAGQPLTTAMRAIADNMEPPVSTEFRRVMNEVSLGAPLNEALYRMARRVDMPDVKFFTTVINVQQESGGNLAEVLGNLSKVIRARRILRRKVLAMTSEARATMYILGGLPVFEICILQIMSPGYLDPLFTTGIGGILLFIAGFLVFSAVWIVKQMSNMEV